MLEEKRVEYVWRNPLNMLELYYVNCLVINYTKIEIDSSHSHLLA